MKKLLLFIVLALIAVTSVQLWATKDRTDQKDAMDKVDVKPETQVGGSFTLTDQTGKVVHDTDFHGKVLVVFFGFTHCPDVCPITISTMSKMMGLLGDKAQQVQPLFITVDPERDTPQVMADFLRNFDKSIVGLTGTVEQIRQISDQYKVYYARVDAGGTALSPESKPSATPDFRPAESKESPEKKADYSVDHSGYIYLMGKDGQFIKVLPYNTAEEELAHGVEAVLN